MQKVYTKDRNTGDGEREIVEVDSFTTPRLKYSVDPERGFCTCKRARFGGKCRKHVQLAKAITKCRRLRFGARIAEARVTELAHKVYAPVRPNEDFVASYRLLLDTLASRHATEGMARAAFKRHGRVLLLAERKVA
jgi:hypothetical protein